MKFLSYSFSDLITSEIIAQGYTTPTPIQEKAIPEVLAGKDVMGLAQTGTGKTAAFVLPMLQRFLNGPKGRLRGLVIAPTRELAEQINQTIVALGKRTGLKSICIYGGVGMNGQINNLRRGVDVVVACPGRLLDHIKQHTIKLSTIEVLVLDEADHMFDMGFLPTIKDILRNVPSERQTLLFSATMPTDIRKLANAILKSPVSIEIENSRPVDAITHTLFPVKNHLKTYLLLEILRKTATQSVVVFTRTKHRAKSLDEKLQRSGYRSASLQGNLSQNRRQAALDGFRDGKFDIMVATDIAARGIDVSQVSHVINFDMPDTAEAYTHRTGRTGRASRTGDAFTLVTVEDTAMLKQIERIMRRTLPTRIMEGFNYELAKETVGDQLRPQRRPFTSKAPSRSGPNKKPFRK